MTYCFHAGICLFLVILQTAFMPNLPVFHGAYDLLLPFIIFLGFFRSLRESIPVIIFFGFIMDNISGGPFGVYVTTYFWIFICVRWAIKFFHAHNRALLLFAVATSVLIENFIFLGTTAMIKPALRFPASALSSITIQILWAMCTGPLFLFFFNYIHKGWDKLISEMSAERDG